MTDNRFRWAVLALLFAIFLALAHPQWVGVGFEAWHDDAPVCGESGGLPVICPPADHWMLRLGLLKIGP
jgi:hypothetical protein